MVAFPLVVLANSISALPVVESRITGRRFVFEVAKVRNASPSDRRVLEAIACNLGLLLDFGATPGGTLFHPLFVSTARFAAELLSDEQELVPTGSRTVLRSRL